MREILTGICLNLLNVISGDWVIPGLLRRKKSLCPERVIPPSTHVARARSHPKLAGVLGIVHVPSGLTLAVRLRTLTTQFSLSCAQTLPGANNKKNRSRHRRGPVLSRFSPAVVKVKNNNAACAFCCGPRGERGPLLKNSSGE